MQPMNAVPVRPGYLAGPGDYILPVKYEYVGDSGASTDPRLVAYWQRVPPQSGTVAGYWALVQAVGG